MSEILKSLDKVNQGIQAIRKDQQGFGYKFRGIDQVLCTLGPLFREHKVITRRENVKSERTIRTVVDKSGREKNYIEVLLQCDYVFVSLVDGSELKSQGFGEGQDSSGGDKASSMATSNSYKYVIFEMFNIPTEEQKDSDQVTAEIGETKITEEVGQAIKKHGESFRKTKPIPTVKNDTVEDAI